MKKHYMPYCFLATILAATYYAWAGPEWNHADQGQWGALDDTTQATAPLMYPYAECAIGQHQSPVDLAAAAKADRLDNLRMTYYTDTPILKNTGHAVQVNASADYKGALRVGDDAYPLIQSHFHAPSEHVFGNKQYAGELHFVHIRADGRMAVMGVLLEEGEANASLQAILDNIASNPTGMKLNPMSFLPEDKRHFYTYAGSLTTPPCSEGVNWYVLAEPITVSSTQITQLQSLISADNGGMNNRMTQNLNGRTVSGRTE